MNVNSHIEHLEDLLLTGKTGTKQVFRILIELEKFTSTGKCAYDLSIKWDGSPSIVAGYNNGRFFVGTKSVFSKNPKVNYTYRDIHNNHSEPDLQNKLKKSLDYLPLVINSGIHQGDLMFCDNDLHESDKSCQFQPNTIQYKIPRDQAKNKRLGVVFHTSYNGNLGNLSSNELRKDQITNHNNIWQGEIDVNWGSEFEVYSKLKELIPLFKINWCFLNNKFIQTFKRYINISVKLGQPEVSFGQFKTFYYKHNTKDVNELKTDRGKRERLNQIEKDLNNLDHYQTSIENFFQLYGKISCIKNDMIEHLDYLNNENETIEGYVVYCPNTGLRTKLVNRMKFSRDNFNRERN